MNCKYTVFTIFSRHFVNWKNTWMAAVVDCYRQWVHCYTMGSALIVLLDVTFYKSLFSSTSEHDYFLPKVIYFKETWWKYIIYLYGCESASHVMYRSNFIRSELSAQCRHTNSNQGTKDIWKNKKHVTHQHLALCWF